MSAYKKWAGQKFNENQMYLVKPQTTNLLTMPADWKELCEINYQQFLSGKYNIDLWPWQMYDECVKAKYIEKNAYEDYLGGAIFYVKSWVPEDQYQLKLRSEILKEGKKNFMIIEKAKRLAVHALFETAKEKKYTHLFIKE